MGISQRFLIILLMSFLSSSVYSQYVISGKVTDKSSGEDIPYAAVSIKGTTTGVMTNDYGFYSLTVDNKYIKEGKVVIVFSFVGYKKIEKEVALTSDVKLNIRLETQGTQLKGVEITADAATEKENLRSTEMSTTKVQVRDIKYIPAIAGESDILKVMQLLPGVTGGAQGSASLFVRGGDADQNLVLLDEATVYNVGHLFGFFSVFNSDAISDVTMIKGAFPPNYGGRLSAILDVRMKEGNSNKFHGAGGIGLLSSRIMFEGPVIKNKMSFLVSARRTYIDKVFRMVGMEIPYYFYDINAKMNYRISDDDRLFYSFYYGNDVLNFDENDVAPDDSTDEDLALNFGFILGNITNTLRWNHIYNSKLFSNISLVVTNFDYKINGSFEQNKVFINSNIMDVGIKADYDYFKNNTNHIKFGGSLISHNFRPNVVSTSGDIASLLKSSKGKKMFTQEFALYAQSDKDLGGQWKINYGLRFSGSFVKNKIYAGLEPRVAVRYLVSENNSLKASYSRMKQYIHRVSSSTVALPTDLWYPVAAKVKPQIADQVALGYSHLFTKHNISFEFEVFYKKMQNLIEYREGANLILNDNFEDELLQGRGKAYGAEMLLRKRRGRFNGWVSYTLSKTTRYFDELNKGKPFPSKYDRRHNFAIVMNYELTERWVFSAVWVYQTGSRFTAQIGQYIMPNPSMTDIDIVPVYTDRNAVEMAPSHRLDLNITLKSKKERKFKSEWSFGCYNLYNRAQPYRVKVVPNDSGTGYKYVQPGLFGFIPSIAYNFNF